MLRKLGGAARAVAGAAAAGAVYGVERGVGARVLPRAAGGRVSACGRTERRRGSSCGAGIGRRACRSATRSSNRSSSKRCQASASGGRDCGSRSTTARTSRAITSTASCHSGRSAHKAWELRSVCTRRGRFSLGPVWVTSGDPFGIFRVSRKLTDGTTVVVYPRTVPLPALRPRSRRAARAARCRACASRSARPTSRRVREYRPGDAFNRIHWPTTARTTRLMVREFELDPTADIWIVLDLNRDVHVGSGVESTEEYAVTAAASLARHLLDQGRAVGLVSQTVTLPADRGPRQVERILEVLALVRASSHADAGGHARGGDESVCAQLDADRRHAVDGGGLGALLPGARPAAACARRPCWSRRRRSARRRRRCCW